MQSINPAIPFLIHSLCGGLILLTLNTYLRHKDVKNTGLDWLGISLLSWAAARVAELITGKVDPNFPTDHLLYLFSPISSVLFTMTAFRIAPVREVLRPQRAQYWSRITVATVAGISTVAWLALLLGHVMIGKYLDAFASSLALTALGLGLSYSFRKAEHKFLVWLTVMTFSVCVGRQFHMAAFGVSTGDMIIFLHLANSVMMTMIMLLAPFGLGWAGQDNQKLKTVRSIANVYIIAVFIDLRNSTAWADIVAERDFQYVRTVIEKLGQWAWACALATPLGSPKFVKQLGDGYLFVWEVPAASMITGVNACARLCYTLFKSYPRWIRCNAQTFHWGVPVGLGIGIDAGPAIRMIFEDGSADYLGDPLNHAAKLQELARPHGGVVIKEKVWNLLDGSRRRFPVRAMMKFGECEVRVRMVTAAFNAKPRNSKVRAHDKRPTPKVAPATNATNVE
jgi:class 3 adenylate cyclase